MLHPFIIKRNANRAFSLVEVVLALFIFSIGMASAISMIHGSIKAQRRQAQRVHSRAVAEQITLEIAAEGYSTLASKLGTGAPQREGGEGWIRIGSGKAKRASRSEESKAITEFGYSLFLKPIQPGSPAGEFQAIQILANAWPLDHRYDRDLIATADEAEADSESAISTEVLDQYYSFGAPHPFEQSHSIITAPNESQSSAE